MDVADASDASSEAPFQPSTFSQIFFIIRGERTKGHSFRLPAWCRPHQGRQGRCKVCSTYSRLHSVIPADFYLHEGLYTIEESIDKVGR